MAFKRSGVRFPSAPPIFLEAQQGSQPIPARAEDFAAELVKPDPLYRAIVVESGSNLAGFCGYFPGFSSWLGKPGVDIQDLYVAEQVHRPGLGARLLKDAIHGARQEWQADYFRLAVDGGNTTGQDFYNRTGMNGV